MCHGKYRLNRRGVTIKLPPRDSIGVKGRIVAMVRRAVEIGGSELFELIYQHHRERPGRSILKAHVWSLRKSGYPIHAYQEQRRVWVYRWGDKEPARVRRITGRTARQPRDKLGRWQ